MAGNLIQIEVHRDKKASARLLSVVILVLGIVTLFMGIMLDRGFLMVCLLLAMLYYAFDAFSRRDYEYTYENERLKIDVIYGGRYRKNAQLIPMEQVVVIAQHDAEAVFRYRKGQPEGNLRKYDYTSYKDEIPYYTLIARDADSGLKSKVLLDLNQEMLGEMKRRFPDKVCL